LCDSINPPKAEVENVGTFFAGEPKYSFKTSVGLFSFAAPLVRKQRLVQLTPLFEECVKKNIPQDRFLKRAREEIDFTDEEWKASEESLRETFTKLENLEGKQVNGIWANILKNAFAPLFVGQFDLIAGNPPWVNWEALPQAYRDVTASLWQKYNLFTHKGLRARLGSAKDDISVLMTYVAADRYLKDSGRLAFVITQTLFKTVGGGEGFRRFKLGQNGVPLKIEQVDDMIDLQPFEAATNRTAVFSCEKGEQTVYPVPYILWQKSRPGAIYSKLSFDEVFAITKRSNLSAQPIGEAVTSPWISARRQALKAVTAICGSSDYRARAGCCGWLNSVYLVKAIQKENGLIRVHNFIEHAKKQVPKVEALLESVRVFPTLRGREIERWRAISELGIVVGQDEAKPSKGLPLKTMETKYPYTFKYFAQFKDLLSQRNGYEKYLLGEPFYAVYNFGPYTFSPCKVVWTRVGIDIKSAVVGNQNSGLFDNRIVIPIETVVFVPFDNMDEAHYFCSVLNSNASRFIIIAYSNKGTGSFGSPHILEHVGIPKFDAKNQTHQNLCSLSKDCHKKVTSGVSVTDLEEQIDDLAAQLWGLTNDEMKSIKESLAILNPPRRQRGQNAD
jgi:hypothetical protein